MPVCWCFKCSTSIARGEPVAGSILRTCEGREARICLSASSIDEEVGEEVQIYRCMQHNIAVCSVGYEASKIFQSSVQ